MKFQISNEIYPDDHHRQAKNLVYRQIFYNFKPYELRAYIRRFLMQKFDALDSIHYLNLIKHEIKISK